MMPPSNIDWCAETEFPEENYLNANFNYHYYLNYYNKLMKITHLAGLSAYM